jgi:ABC-type sugar transport system ATPase subunit
MVFQSYALYPHLTVFRNLALPLELRSVPRAETEQRVEAAAALLDIAYLLNRKPGKLSGGQRQRVALARAIVRDPAVFLFDEPLSNLDAQHRAELRHEIAALHHRSGASLVIVTHDQSDAAIADRIVEMRDGRIVQAGTPGDMLDIHAPLAMRRHIETMREGVR